MPDNPPPLLTIEQLADYLQMKEATLRRWRASRPRKGPRAVVIGKQVRYRWEDVDNWLKEQREAWTTEDGPLEEAGEEFGPGSGDQPGRP